MRHLPWRPDNQISQTFNSGVCTVYTQRDTATPGLMPRPELERKAFLRYDEQRLGISRYYTARQANADVERVLRVPKGPAAQIPNPQDVVRTEDGVYYQVDFVQTVPGVWPACLDLTLTRFVQDAGAIPSPSGGGGSGETADGEGSLSQPAADSSPKRGALGGGPQ